ncbi:hypothetical protein [Roseicyclus elongatus]|uniref:hypothetical protein n=1 Tax=Roseicyclus elongatus TaxID=159346 RepID=UPI00046D75FF|nr:hypothetical protein [Roseibacterium elongatum]
MTSSRRRTPPCPQIAEGQVDPCAGQGLDPRLNGDEGAQGEPIEFEIARHFETAVQIDPVIDLERVDIDRVVAEKLVHMAMQSHQPRLLTDHDHIRPRGDVKALPSEMGGRTQPPARGIGPVARHGGRQVVRGNHLSAQTIFHQLEGAIRQGVPPRVAVQQRNGETARLPAIVAVTHRDAVPVIVENAHHTQDAPALVRVEWLRRHRRIDLRRLGRKAVGLCRARRHHKRDRIEEGGRPGALSCHHHASCFFYSFRAWWRMIVAKIVLHGSTRQEKSPLPPLPPLCAVGFSSPFSVSTMPRQQGRAQKTRGESNDLVGDLTHPPAA